MVSVTACSPLPSSIVRIQYCSKLIPWHVEINYYETLHAAFFGSYQAMESSQGDERASAKALADMKFTYVVSCQLYGAQKKSDDLRDRSCYNNILNLMIK